MLEQSSRTITRMTRRTALPLLCLHALTHQAWIRNSNLTPDWLRIGTDIVGGAPAPNFNMTFSLTGESVPEAGTPGQANCLGQIIATLAQQFGGADSAASNLGFSSVQALHDGFTLFCKP